MAWSRSVPTYLGRGRQVCRLAPGAGTLSRLRWGGARSPSCNPVPASLGTFQRTCLDRQHLEHLPSGRCLPSPASSRTDEVQSRQATPPFPPPPTAAGGRPGITRLPSLFLAATISFTITKSTNQSRARRPGNSMLCWIGHLPSTLSIREDPDASLTRRLRRWDMYVCMYVHTCMQQGNRAPMPWPALARRPACGIESTTPSHLPVSWTHISKPLSHLSYGSWASARRRPLLCLSLQPLEKTPFKTSKATYLVALQSSGEVCIPLPPSSPTGSQPVDQGLLARHVAPAWPRQGHLISSGSCQARHHQGGDEQQYPRHLCMSGSACFFVWLISRSCPSAGRSSLLRDLVKRGVGLVKGVPCF